jgi:peptide/nickel transport system substrate-binding protein
VAAGISVAAAWSVNAARAADLIIAQGTEPISFDPSQFATGNQVFLHQLYDSLVDIGADGKPTPALAESWQRSDDGLTVTFRLRAAKFHTGRVITADDVAFTIKRYLDPQVGANLGERMGSITDVKAVDPQTVQLTLSSLTPGLFDLLSAVFIQNKDEIGNIAREDVGSGPYKLSDFQPGVSFTMTRFADSWRNDQTKPDNIVIRIIPDEASAAEALRAGSVDVLLQTGALTAKNLKGTDGINIWRPDTAPVTYYLMANTTHGPLANQLFRQAIEHSIDRKTIADVAYSGAAVPTCQPWAASHWAHDASLESECAFDLKKAADLLAQSGVKDATITVNTAVDAYSLGSTATAQILKEDLAKIGVTLNIMTYEQAQARKKLLASDFDMLLHNYTEGGNDPQFIMPSGIYGPDGRSKFNDPQYASLVEQANNTLDLDKRKGLYSQISKRIIENADVMPIVDGFREIPMKSSVNGMVLDVSGFPVLSGVTIDGK